MEKLTVRFYLIGFILLMAMSLFRFNSNQLLVPYQSYDAKYFEAYVEYFRGEVPSAPIRPASNWRFLVPLIASVLPFSPATSINLVNLVCLAASLLIFIQTMRYLQIDALKQKMAGLLFIVSFPVFFYGCIGYVDPGALLFLSMGIYFRIRNRRLGFAFTVLIGLMAKETVILLLPFGIVFDLVQRNWKGVAGMVLLTVLFFIEYHLIKTYAPLDAGEIRFNSWHVNRAALQFNLHRLNTSLSFLLSFGLTGILWLRALLTGKRNPVHRPVFWACQAGIVSTFGLYLFSYITTVADGRIIWHAVFFMLLTIFEPAPRESHD